MDSSISSKKALEGELELERHETSEISKDLEPITEEQDKLLEQVESSNSSDTTAQEVVLNENEEDELAKTLERITEERDKLIEEVESLNERSEEELLLAKKKTNEISRNLERVSTERNMLKEKVESLTLLKKDIPSVDEELSAELDDAMDTILNLEEKLRKVANEKDKPFRFDESVDLFRQVAADPVSIAEYDSAMATIGQLEEQLLNNKGSEILLETGERSQVLSEKIDDMKKESKEIQEQAATDLNEKNEEIRRLKNELEAALRNLEHNDEGRDHESHTHLQMTQEIQMFEDEVARLNRELADSNNPNQSAGEIDHMSPAALQDRYEELRRLSDALLDKDTFVLKLTTKLEKLEDYIVQAGGFLNGTEAIALRTRVNELQSQVYHFQQSQSSNPIPFNAPTSHESQHYSANPSGTSAKPGFQNHDIDQFSRPAPQSHNMHSFHNIGGPNLQSSNTNQISSPTRSNRSNNTSRRNPWSMMHSTFDDTSEEESREEVNRESNHYFKETNLRKQLNLLRKENSTLRADSDMFCKKAKVLENTLMDERATVTSELNSLAKNLHGVDNFYTAAETMSREVKTYKKKPTWNNALGQVDENEVDRKPVQKSLRMVSRSRAHSKQGQPSGFMKLLDSVAIAKQKQESHKLENLEGAMQGMLDDNEHSEYIDNEHSEYIQKQKAAKKRRNRMKKQSSHKSGVGSFL